MNAPWFDPIAYSWIPGTVFGSLGGLLGALSGILAPMGKAKHLVLGTWWLFTAAGIALLLAAGIAFFTGQPYGVWYSLGLPGLMGSIVFPMLLPVIHLRYREAEQRRMHANDLA